MSTTSSSRGSSKRAREIRRVLFDVARRRSTGLDIPDDVVVAEHQELLPELAEELLKLQRIGEAIQGADEQQYEVVWERIKADSARRRQLGSETDEFDPEAAADRELPEVLSMIGRYRVVGVLGEGGFARVYHAKDENLQRDVAIKVPHRPRGTDPDEMGAYWAEARIVAALDHAAIVPVYDVGRTRDGHCYVVSKMVRGENLAQRIKRARLPQAEAIQIILVIADALHYAHSLGLVHRDIKPANILLDAKGIPFVVDFGLALTECDSRDGHSYAGTPGYMSPEQARGEAHRVDARSDLFSLGVVFYELLTGEKPFQADSYDELLEQVLWEDPLPMRHWDEAIDDELERICAKLLSKRAADRYATAAELIEDLRHWTRQGTMDAEAETTLSSSIRSLTTASDLQTPKIIPRGLRSFDANDADFYPHLVPGPRDRTGLPESIRQWKNRIEAPDPHATFAVGLIYGPSGCGKSSLVRAGLLPRLSPKIRTVYVQATGEDTQQRLQLRLAHQFTDIEPDAELTESLASIRRGIGLGRNEKLLLVIDQFEQWLHGRKSKDQRNLLAALRQCDGQRLICLLLVRDDFWLAVGRFMAELEIELVQGQNSALVDLFDITHARDVLAEFGRAYGQLPDDLRSMSSEQAAFLQQAIRGLADEDRVVPVRLALFAEMVKSRAWTPETLRTVGGAQGVGVAFLEETFSARTANPRYRIHQKAIRAVLGTLLPERGSEIRGRICSNIELLDISGYGKKPREFQELMRILDGETRLLTPMDLDAIDTHDLTMSPGNRYYQLTHDYLVPNLRQWLTAKQKSTRSGRLELRLAERSRLWNDRPERRQLPSILEYFSIRLFTRASGWTPSQRRLMKAAARHHLRTLLLIATLLITVLLAGSRTSEWVRRMVMKIRARTTVAWMALGEAESVWPLLRPSADPTERTEVIHSFSSIVTNPEDVATQLATQEDVGIRRAMVLVAGELAGSADEQPLRSSESRRDSPLAAQLQTIYRNDPDPGLHAAAYWTLKRIQTELAALRIDSALQSEAPLGERRWFVNSMGHTMVVAPGWTDFLMGSDESDDERSGNETLQSRQIRRSFFICSHETTVAQFAAFLHDAAGADQADRWLRAVSPNEEAAGALPCSMVTWYQAAAYCNWLSAKELIPESQWCYLPNDSGKYGPGMRVAEDFQRRRGYRLPTELEWEFACRAGTTTPRFFGSNAAWLNRYAATDPSGAATPEPVCQYKPNDLGLFDMLGNVAEWCQDLYESNDAGSSSEATGTHLLFDTEPRVVRGGSICDPIDRLRSAARDSCLPGEQAATIGFRVARSNR